MPASNPTKPIKIAAISYLNAVPLTYRLRYGPAPEWLEAEFMTPAGIAEAFRRQAAGVALMPSIEYQRIPGIRVLPNLAIASPRGVGSVLLVARCPIRRLRRVGITVDSRTSVALLRVLLGHFLSVTCTYELYSSLPLALERFDGVLVIGDTALTADFGRYDKHDLAVMWREHTNLPFVFGLWAARPEFFSRRLYDFLLESKAAGIAEIPRIARDFGQRLGLPEPAVRSYLQDNLSYDLNRPEQEALRLFYRLSAAQGLLEQVKPLEFADAG